MTLDLTTPLRAGLAGVCDGGVGRPRNSSPSVLPVKNYRYAGWYVNLRAALRANASVAIGGEGVILRLSNALDTLDIR